jgi:hypothetical protein
MERARSTSPAATRALLLAVLLGLGLQVAHFHGHSHGENGHAHGSACGGSHPDSGPTVAHDEDCPTCHLLAETRSFTPPSPSLPLPPLDSADLPDAEIAPFIGVLLLRPQCRDPPLSF